MFIRNSLESDFLGFIEEFKLLNYSHKGVVLNGRYKRLTHKASFEHIAVVARTGGGKTTRYIIPNILKLDNCSMVITDPSGELFEKTSKHLKKKGFEVLCINPTDIKNSLLYNPLALIKEYEDINEVAKVLVTSANPNTGASDSFWLQGAEKLLVMIIKALKNHPNKSIFNLISVKRLINAFGKELDDFIAEYADKETFYEYKGFLSGNEKTVQSIVSTAQVSLNALSNPNIATLFSNHTLDFKKLRERKCALFIIVPEQKIPYYTFFLNLFYTQFFNVCMQERKKEHLPIFCLLDEFGHLQIPHFSTIITTIRKYKVSISIILQSISQLHTRYGRSEAETILNGGIASKIFFSGADLATTQMLEQILGKTKQEKQMKNGFVKEKEENLLNASAIRTLEDNQAIYLYSNKKPILLKMKPIFLQD